MTNSLLLHADRAQVHAVPGGSDLAVLMSQIRALLHEKTLLTDSAEDDLLESGVLNSLSLIDLLISLEQRFQIRIPLEELQIDDVRSVASLAALVRSRQSATPPSR